MALTNVLTLRSMVARSRAATIVVESMLDFEASVAGGVSARAIERSVNTKLTAMAARRCSSPECFAHSATAPPWLGSQHSACRSRHDLMHGFSRARRDGA